MIDQLMHVKIKLNGSQTECEIVDWFQLTWGEDQCLFHMSTMMKLQVLCNDRDYLLSKMDLLSLEGVTFYLRKQLYVIGLFKVSCFYSNEIQ